MVLRRLHSTTTTSLNVRVVAVVRLPELVVCCILLCFYWYTFHCKSQVVQRHTRSSNTDHTTSNRLFFGDFPLRVGNGFVFNHDQRSPPPRPSRTRWGSHPQNEQQQEQNEQNQQSFVTGLLQTEGGDTPTGKPNVALPLKFFNNESGNPKIPLLPYSNPIIQQNEDNPQQKEQDEEEQELVSGTSMRVVSSNQASVIGSSTGGARAFNPLLQNIYGALGTGFVLSQQWLQDIYNQQLQMDNLQSSTRIVVTAVDNRKTQKQSLPKPRKSKHFTIDTIFEEQDLTRLASNLRQSDMLSDDSIFKRLAMTFFAPTDKAFSRILQLAEPTGPYGEDQPTWHQTETVQVDDQTGGQDEMLESMQNLLDNDEKLEIPNEEKVMEKVFMYHIVSPKIISPRHLKFGKKIRVTARNKETLVLERRSGYTGFSSIFVNGIQVIDVVLTKRGVIYKIDDFLLPKWNKGPSMVQWLKHTPGFDRTVLLLNALPELAEVMEWLGPLTMFVVPDEGWKLPNGQDVPDCVFESLMLPQNQQYLQSLFLWNVLPGIWDRKLVESRDWLPVISGTPKLAVAHVQDLSENSGHDTYQYYYRKFKPSYNHSFSSTESDEVVHHPYRPADRSTESDDAEEKPINYKDYYTYIEGSQVIDWDVPVSNGLIHILGSVTFRTDLDLLPITFWQCLHRFCFDCPLLTSLALWYIDEWGTLPGPEPSMFDAPPSVRPEWVCKGQPKWYPPGWKPINWETYMKKASNISGPQFEENDEKKRRKRLRTSVAYGTNTREIEKVALMGRNGFREAATEIQRIEERYAELRRRAAWSQTIYGGSNEQTLIRKWQTLGFWQMKFGNKFGTKQPLQCKGEEKELGIGYRMSRKYS